MPVEEDEECNGLAFQIVRIMLELDRPNFEIETLDVTRLLETQFPDELRQGAKFPRAIALFSCR